MKAEKSKKKIMAPVVALLATAIILAVAMAGTAQAALDKRSNVYEANIQLTSLDAVSYTHLLCSLHASKRAVHVQRAPCYDGKWSRVLIR